ncbi:uncharacterized protein LOC130895322 [Diorhabda carinulata]|uniref:uncharacterized protein LOC130895322 n=1 Tax=Diorhabda carinulata TaxID=1163345 RepID=UPI0025A2433C|nr:uncharacterized protein LOC130895322 [Diorhabda carinulata]
MIIINNNNYRQFIDAQLSKHIFQSVQEKLIDKAEILVGNRAELTDWPRLKEALIQCFADRRNIDCLVQELTRMKPFRNEPLMNFGSRIQLLRSSIAQKISNNPNITNAEKVCQINHYDKTALSTFIAGCSGTLRNNLHLKNPASLEDAMAYLNEFENFEKLYGNLNDNNRATTSRFNSNYRQPYPQPRYYPENQTPPSFQQPYHSVDNNKPVNQFPSQPINIQPRQMPPRQYPTNKQVFGPPQNVFRPNQKPMH